MEQQNNGTLGLTNFERFITIICWWQPFVALISLFFGSAPRQLERHAKWSVITVVVVFAGALVLGLLFAGLGYLVAGEQGASAGAAINGHIRLRTVLCGPGQHDSHTGEPRTVLYLGRHGLPAALVSGRTGKSSRSAACQSIENQRRKERSAWRS